MLHAVDHPATPETARAKPAALNWEDPFGLDAQLTDSECDGGHGSVVGQAQVLPLL